jgi:hypothetical protein
MENYTDIFYTVHKRNVLPFNVRIVPDVAFDGRSRLP